MQFFFLILEPLEHLGDIQLYLHFEKRTLNKNKDSSETSYHQVSVQ